MTVLFVIDPLPGLSPDIDASVGLMAATQAQGDDVWCCTPEDLAWCDGRLLARARQIVLRPRRRNGTHQWLVSSAWYEELSRVTRDVARDFDLVHLRIDPPVDDRYLHTTYLLDLVEAAGTPVVNRPSGIRALHEKLCVLQFPDLCPRTYVDTAVDDLRGFVAEVGAAVVKPVDGFAGRGVWLVRDDPAALALLESATGGGTRQVIAQEHLGAVERGNKRLFLLAGEVAGAVLRRPSAEDFRIGPPVAEAVLDSADITIADALRPHLLAHGIALAGVDVIDGRLIEVNVTCPGGMAKADALLGTDLCGDVVCHLSATSSPTLISAINYLEGVLT
jgi:glutathione synthase